VQWVLNHAKGKDSLIELFITRYSVILIQHTLTSAITIFMSYDVSSCCYFRRVGDEEEINVCAKRSSSSIWHEFEYHEEGRTQRRPSKWPSEGEICPFCSFHHNLWL